MGEITDAILEGVYCQYCGDFMGEGDGYPVTCEACKQDGVDVPEEDEIDLDKAL